MTKSTKEKARFWCIQNLDNLELLHATCITYASARHTHETFAIGVIEQGAVELIHKGTKYIASKGSIVVINPDDAHACNTAVEEGYSQCMMYPSVTLLQQVTSEMTSQKQTTLSFSTPVIQDHQLAQQIYSLRHSLYISTCQLEWIANFCGTLTRLINLYANEHITLKRIGTERQAVKQVKEYLEAHYTDNVLLEQLAHITNLSPFHLTRVFCHEVGLPPHAYLTQVRVLQAKKLLCQGLAIAQAALETGFTHQSHLNKHFKRIVGVTPKQYQAMSKNVQDAPS